MPGVNAAVSATIEADLSRLVEGEVRFGAHDRMLYATDASIYQAEPIGVVVPRSIADVEATVAYCARKGLPILPRGAGTSLAGQTVGTAIVIDFSAHCDAVLEVDAAGRRARVQPGLVLDRFNEALAPHGLMFGPDVATSTHATLGGMIGNNSAGAHSVLYGRTVEHVEAVDVLLADGTRVRLDRGAAGRDARVQAITAEVVRVVRGLEREIDARFPRTRRRVNGYNLDLVLAALRASTPGTIDAVNLAHLICGSEGTLGVMVEATVGLVDAPRARGLAIVSFDDVDTALAAVGDILETEPAAVELIDDVIIGLARANLEYRRYVELLPAPPGGRTGAVLYVEYFADDAAALAARFDALSARYGAAAVRRASTPAEIAGAWKLRKAGEPLLHGQPGPRKPITFIEDTAVDAARLPEFVRRFRAILTRHGTTASYYAHASVGCLHIRPMVCLDDPDDVRAMQAIVAEATELVIEFGGALSGEHGDGRLRSHLLERFYGRAICDGFRAVRKAFDPEGRLNPGNITEPGPMLRRLRVLPDDRAVRVPGVATWFRYDHGFGEAVELCNGAGVCRKTAGGTMCPSYRATRDERHTTRGRGNALRLAITGQLARGGGGPAWGDAETMRTLDLCLSCKACKTECPSGVDMAKLKAEYLAQSYAASGGPPWRARAFGSIRAMNRLGAIAPRLANGVAAIAPVRAIMNRVLGLDARRSLPRFERSLLDWFTARAASDGGGEAGPEIDPTRPAVVLFADCFTTWNEPQIGRAAVRVLEGLGYRVVLSDAGCCGRAMISNGLLDDATSTARATAATLIATLEDSGAEAVVGCEPSCVSAMTDDWPALRLERPGIDDLAARTRLVEDFVGTDWDDHPRPRRVTPDPSDAPVLVHGHCHQKALWSVTPTAALLGRIHGDVQVLDAGCCGMAGAFGFTRDHYDLSMQIAELALFPALRAAPNATVAAPGTSCRHQIRDGLGREARHPIELVADAME